MQSHRRKVSGLRACEMLDASARAYRAVTTHRSNLRRLFPRNRSCLGIGLVAWVEPYGSFVGLNFVPNAFQTDFERLAALRTLSTLLGKCLPANGEIVSVKSPLQTVRQAHVAPAVNDPPSPRSFDQTLVCCKGGDSSRRGQLDRRVLLRGVGLCAS